LIGNVGVLPLDLLHKLSAIAAAFFGPRQLALQQPKPALTPAIMMRIFFAVAVAGGDELAYSDINANFSSSS
jgi:hypothetical protein